MFRRLQHVSKTDLSSPIGSHRAHCRLALTAALCMTVSIPVTSVQASPSQVPDLVARESISSLVYPLMGPRLSSNYGLRKHPIAKKRRHHHGIDLAAPRGAQIRAIASGQVVYADPFGGYGNIVVVRHVGGLTSHYGHCDTLHVKIGDDVRAGDVLGTVGNSGASTGPHLHFEIRLNGKPQDPESYLPGLDSPAQG